MFKKIEALSSAAHQDLRFSKTNSFDFASTVSNAPLTASEFTMAARYYPIVFPDKGTTPIILLALNQNKNNYVDEKGSWKVPYIPAYIRKYPFTLANSDKENKEKFVVCIDRDAPHFRSDQGDPLLTAEGTPSDFTQNAINFLQKFQDELTVTQRACQELEKHGVLADKKINFEKDGQKAAFGGFRCVDMEKLNALEDSVLASWVRNGLIGLIYAHLQSLAHFKTLA